MSSTSRYNILTWSQKEEGVLILKMEFFFEAILDMLSRGKSMISFWGRQLRWRCQLRHGHFSTKLYVKTKELGMGLERGHAGSAPRFASTLIVSSHFSFERLFKLDLIAVCIDSLVMIHNELSQKFYFFHSHSEAKSGTKSRTKSECSAWSNFHDVIPLLPH